MKKLFLSMLLLTTININASQPIKIKVPKEKLAECREIKETVLLLLDDPVLAKRAYLKAYKSTEEYKAAQKAYKSTEEFKASQKDYQSTEEFKASQKDYQKAYRSTKKGKDYQKAYDATEERKAYNAARYQQKKLLAKSIEPKLLTNLIVPQSK